MQVNLAETQEETPLHTQLAMWELMIFVRLNVQNREITATGTHLIRSMQVQNVSSIQELVLLEPLELVLPLPRLNRRSKCATGLHLC
jgi:hypothetical protein